MFSCVFRHFYVENRFKSMEMECCFNVMTFTLASSGTFCYPNSVLFSSTLISLPLAEAHFSVPYFCFFLFYLFLYSCPGLLIDQSVGKTKITSTADFGPLKFHLKACNIGIFFFFYPIKCKLLLYWRLTLRNVCPFFACI